MAFLVEASDPDGSIPVLSATPLPPGATFTNRGNGEGVFDWTPASGQADVYDVTFTASDGELTRSQLVRLTVEPATSPIIVEYLIDFTPGLNLFAYPVVVPAEHGSCFALLSAIGSAGEVDSISRYDSSTGLFETCNQDGGVDFPIVTAEAYAIRMTTDKTVRFAGVAACPAVYLAPGINLVGHTNPPDDLSCFDLLQTLGEDVASIRHLDVQRRAFESCGWLSDEGGLQAVGTDFPIHAADGLVIGMQRGRFLALPGCERQ